VGELAERAPPTDALQWWQKAHDTRLGMKARRMHVPPKDEECLEQLKRKLRP